MSLSNSKLQIIGASVAVALAATYLIFNKETPHETVAILGDVGGTNIRLSLRRLNLKTRTSEEIKPLTKFLSHELPSFDDAVRLFLEEFKGTKNWPTVGVVGVAGAVNNNTVRTTNVKDWPIADGNAIAANFGMKSFTFINDFAAAGYGVCMLKQQDYIKIDQVTPQENGVKVVMGPGTGLGEGFLTKSAFSKCYEVFSSEGGHVDFNITSEEDYKLRQFAIEHINNSKRQDEEDITRVSVERLCAGPAIPLIYDFIKSQHNDINETLQATDKTPNEIIKAGVSHKDQLCSMVVKKFTEILAVEVGNMALKTLPFGGIYLVGGVTNGIADYLEKDQFFLETMYKKGRLSQAVRSVPVNIIKPEVELGILGSEECAFRMLGSFGI